MSLDPHNETTCSLCTSGKFVLSASCTESTSFETCYAPECKALAHAAQTRWRVADDPDDAMARRSLFCTKHLDPTKECKTVLRVTWTHAPKA